ncbi:MAG: PTS system mannose/fructose/sorbose family transporter subunit IID [Pseudomonadota bacterium]|nr:PTS system mannose/fructose/sorbose family transporter subunit IID [Pseudomonadota bacterium]
MTALDLSGFFLRSLFVMSSLNFKRMQNLGFAYAILPLVRNMNGNKERIAAFVRRQLDYFNTHPYLSGAVLGAVIRLEEKEDAVDSAGQAATTKLKESLMGPYAAIGDNFFWGSLRPLAGIVAAILAYEGFVWAPFVFLLIFDPLHLWIRWRGFLEGYRKGREGFAYIQSWDLPRRARCLRWISLTILGVAAGLLIARMDLFPGSFWPRQGANIAVLTAVLAAFLSMRRGMSPLVILYALTAVCAVVMP